VVGPGPAPNTFVVTGPTITVQTGDTPPANVGGAEIEFTFEVQDPTTGEWVVIEVKTCTTGGGGSCSTQFNWDNTGYVPPVTQARITITGVQTDPAVEGTLPGPFIYTLA
jgi:hypothetical protein